LGTPPVRGQHQEWERRQLCQFPQDRIACCCQLSFFLPVLEDFLLLLLGLMLMQLDFAEFDGKAGIQWKNHLLIFIGHFKQIIV
jgi:hypothetical protein